jgi:RNA polymerase sigma-70 factor (ECF subfamily)
MSLMPAQLTTHTSLLARLGDGADATAWKEFEERYGELIRSFARSRGFQPADCDDVVQDVLMSLTKAMRSFEYDPQKGRFRAYLKATTLHAISRLVRQKPGAADLDTIEDVAWLAGSDQAAEQAWEAEWRANHVRQAMRTLELEFTPSQLRAFQQYAVEGHEARDTAAALQITVNQVYQAKSRILKRLVELIEQQVQEEG